MFELPVTEQEVFDKVATHLLTQNERCQEDNCLCRYRLNGMSCAAGCLIPDEFYNEELMEYKSWRDLCCEKLVPDSHTRIIFELQFIHDNCRVEEWRIELINLANIYNLSVENLPKEV